MEFGHVGIRDEWKELLGEDKSGSYGFRRTPDPLFKFAWPDREPAGWSSYKKRDGQTIYQMVLKALSSKQEQPPILTMDGLREVLHGRVTGDTVIPMPPEVHNVLGLLDWFVSELLDRAVEAHEPAGRRLGLLTPKNIVAVGNPISRVVLADSGFRFEGIALPEWFKTMVRPAEEGGAGLTGLWGGNGEKLLRWTSTDSGSRDSAAALRQEELATIARLIAWVLSDGSVTGPRVHREDGRRPNREPAPVWTILEGVTADPPTITSASGFRQAIYQSKPSEHFSIIEVKPIKPPFPWKALAGAGVACLALLVGFLILNQVGTRPGPGPHPLCPDCARASKLMPVLDELEPVVARDVPKLTLDEEKQFWQVEFDLLKELHAVPRDPDERIAKQEDECLKKRREVFYGRLAKAAEEFMYPTKAIGGRPVTPQGFIAHSKSYWEKVEELRDLSSGRPGADRDPLPTFCQDLLDWLNRGQKKPKTFEDYGFTAK